MSPSPARARLGPVLWAMAGVTLLATCAEPVYQNYTQRYPLGTQPETVSLPAHYTGTADPFAGAGAEGFNTLVEAYLDRGHGPITIAGRAPAQRNSPVPARMTGLRQKLIAAGVPASAIRTQLASEGDADTITLSYERYIAVVPACGDWSAPMDFNPNNTDYPNFGCAQQHNLGVMVADPADLASMHHADASDTPGVERVIRVFRGIQAAAPGATETNKNALQSSADQNAASGSTVGAGGAGGSTR
jgi:pilus assembly protein CpaD